MAAADTAKLITELGLVDNLSRGLKNASGNVGKFESRWDRLGNKLKAGLAVGAAGVAGLVGVNIKAGLESLTQLENAQSQVNASILQVGEGWKTTGADIAAIANRIEADVGAAFDDKDILAGASSLIRYGKVAEANIEPALEVMTDLAARTGSVESASTLLAKALADPAKAAGKLSRAGVVLTKAQQKTIKEMVEANDTIGAQRFLLDELAKTTEGAAAATQGPYARSQATLNDAIEDGQRALAEGFLPVIERVRDILQKGLADPKTIETIRNFGKGLAAGLDSVIDIATSLPWATIGDSLRIAGEGAKAVLGAFTSLPPWVQTAVITGWGLNKVTGGFLTDIASGLIKGVLGINAGVVNIKAATVVGGGGLPGTKGGGPPIPGGLPAAAGAAGLGVAAAVSIVGISAAAVALLGIEIGRHVDPGGLRGKQAKADTASARGIPDQFNKPLQELAGHQKDAKAALDALRKEERSGRADQKADLSSLRAQVQRQGERGVTATDQSKTAQTQKQSETTRETSRGAQQVQASQRAAAASTVAAIFTMTGILAATIRANRPVISVSNISRTYNNINSYGPSSADRDHAVGGNSGFTIQ